MKARTDRRRLSQPLPEGFVPTSVVNVRFEECDVYVGRRFGRFRSSDGYFGNPFKGEGSISRFEEYFFARLEADPDFETRVRSLQGKRLGWWCVPGPCHAQTIALWVDYVRLMELGVDPETVRGFGELDPEPEN